MKKYTLLIPLFFVFSGVTNASVISFTPSGVSTVSQASNIYWDMLSDATSTSNFGAIGEFNLTDHGDFHFDTLAADMVNIGTDTGGKVLAFGEAIGSGSNWSNAYYFVGTTDYEGTMSFGGTGYFGLSFLLLGQTHYGWVQIAENSTTQSILGWGYDSVAGQSITAGDIGVSAVPIPAAVWLFGSGLMGLLGVRKKSKLSVLPA